MKVWTMPRIGVELFAANEFVSTCIIFTGDGDCGAGIDFTGAANPDGGMNFDIISLEYDNNPADGVLSQTEILAHSGDLGRYWQRCGHHQNGEVVRDVGVAFLVDVTQLAHQVPWQTTVYYWHEVDSQGSVYHAMQYVPEGSGGPGYIVTNAS